MNIQDLNSVIKSVLETTPIQISDIPNINLYMDQVLTLLDNNLEDYKRNPDDKLLTKTMINNYTKDKLIPPPVKKKYSQEHIILLILIYHLKNLLTINDIAVISKTIDDEELDLFKIYNSFLELQTNVNSSFEDEIRSTISKVNDLNPISETEFKLLTVLSLIVESNIKKRLAENIIDDLMKSNLEK